MSSSSSSSSTFSSVFYTLPSSSTSTSSSSSSSSPSMTSPDASTQGRASHSLPPSPSVRRLFVRLRFRKWEKKCKVFVVFSRIKKVLMRVIAKILIFKAAVVVMVAVVVVVVVVVEVKVCDRE
ncbi:hypothetical protein E2C01_063294 [Portunus trituberculatus]|uniref:Uncharacterized protein n=1 Tax=Portunus trituberculatus TaxID=210409 RepID=A0A5B7HH66_PORTR|nr:hypothetical protein [Portunus trituberculatus]